MDAESINYLNFNHCVLFFMPADCYYVNQYTQMPFVNSELLQFASCYLNVSPKMFHPISITAAMIKTRIKARAKEHAQ